MCACRDLAWKAFSFFQEGEKRRGQRMGGSKIRMGPRSVDVSFSIL